MQPPPPVPDLLAALQLFAGRITALLEESGVDWGWRPAAEAWSLSEVMCHLRDVEQDVHLPRYRAVITRDNPFLSGVDSDNWAAARAYREQDGRQAAHSFLALRFATLALLGELDDEQWSRTANHAFFGTTSLQELTYLAVQHDTAHWQQIRELRAVPG